jgi:hypothetical protein
LVRDGRILDVAGRREHLPENVPVLAGFARGEQAE